MAMQCIISVHVYIGIGDTRKSAETWLLEQSAMGLQLYTASRSYTQHAAMLMVRRWRQGSITVKGTLSIASICICCQTISVSVSREDECSAGWVAGHAAAKMSCLGRLRERRCSCVASE